MAPTAIFENLFDPFNINQSSTVTGGLRAHYLAPDLSSQVFKSKSLSANVNHGDNDNDEILADLQKPSDRPDISFMPAWSIYQDRTTRLKEERICPEQHGKEGLQEGLPEGFPASIEGPRLWSGSDTAQGGGGKVEEFVISLEDTEIRDIEAALAYFKALPGQNGPDQISKSLFPLPNLGPKLDKLSEDIHSGQGIIVLRGLEPGRYTDLENVILYTGISSYIAEKRGCQDRGGTMLTHIVSRGHRDETSPAYTTAGLPFHSDVCDILALYAKERAPQGGEISFASSAAVYNEIAASRPDVIKLLASKVWCYDSERPLLPNWPRRRLLHLEPKHGPMFLFSRRKLTGSNDLPLSPSIPVMSEVQAEALDMVHFVAEKHSIRFQMQSGDILFSNNLALLHARGPYVETVASPKKRHLLRLWLRNDQRAWTTPQGLEEDWFSVYGDSERRGRAFWTISADDLDMDRFVKQKYTCPT